MGRKRGAVGYNNNNMSHEKRRFVGLLQYHYNNMLDNDDD